MQVKERIGFRCISGHTDELGVMTRMIRVTNELVAETKKILSEVDMSYLTKKAAQ